MSEISTVQIGQLPSAASVGDSDLFVIEQNSAAKKLPGSALVTLLGGKAMTEDVKTALLACFAKVAWTVDNGQDYYDALETALNAKEVVSISAVFTQGQNVIYDTDSLDALKQYLTVTASYDDGTTGIVTAYELSGTLTVGTSTITVTYDEKTATFNVTVTAFWDYEWDYTDGKIEEQDGWAVDSSGGSSSLTSDAERVTVPSGKYFQPYMAASGSKVAYKYMTNGYGVLEAVFVGHIPNSSGAAIYFAVAKDTSCRISICPNQGKFKVYSTNNDSTWQVLGDYSNDVEYTIRVYLKGSTADLYVNGTLMAEGISTAQSYGSASNNIMFRGFGTGYYCDLKAYRLRVGSIS